MFSESSPMLLEQLNIMDPRADSRFYLLLIPSSVNVTSFPPVPLHVLSLPIRLKLSLFSQSLNPYQKHISQQSFTITDCRSRRLYHTFIYLPPSSQTGSPNLFA